MWPSTSWLEKVANDNGRTWTGPNSQNLMKHEIIPFISRLPDLYRPFLEEYPSLALIGGTPLLRVRVPELPENGAEIFAKAEWTNPGGSVKDFPVLRMLLRGCALRRAHTRANDPRFLQWECRYRLCDDRLDDGLPGGSERCFQSRIAGGLR